jgi:hypothetical protein
MIETIQDPIEQFEKILDSIIDEGENALFSSDSEEQKQALQKLNLLMKTHFPAGVNGVNGLESLKGIIDDPNLNDQIREIGKKDSDACIRPLIIAYVQNQKPDMAKRINTGDMKMSAEGNQFALAVRKAKAAGMKPGDKFRVGDKEYTLKDAMDIAGLLQEAPAVDTSDMTMAGIGRGEKEEVQKILDQNAESWQKVLAGEDLITFGRLYRELLSYYMSNGEMPYGVVKARDGDPHEWIMDRLGDLGLLETMQEDTESVEVKSKQNQNQKQSDLQAKLKALQDIAMDPNTSKDPALKAELIKRKAELEKQKAVQSGKESYHPDEGSMAELAQTIWDNNPELHSEYKDWQEFAKSEDFQLEVDRLRSKFENKNKDLHKNSAKIEELVKSFYDYTTNKFPKGETAVITAVQKQYGDAAAKTAVEMIKTLQNGQNKEIERIKQLAGYSTKK